MQSLVEDVNSAIVSYRQVAIRAREINDMDKARFAFDCVRRLLMDKFVVEYSDFVTLDDLKNEHWVVQCDCKEIVRVSKNVCYDTVESGYRMIMPVTAKTPRKYVPCPKCEKKVYFETRDLSIERDVSQASIIPYPPTVSDMITVVYNQRQFWHWFDAVWSLVEEKHFLQRQEVSAREEEMV